MAEEKVMTDDNGCENRSNEEDCGQCLFCQMEFDTRKRDEKLVEARDIEFGGQSEYDQRRARNIKRNEEKMFEIFGFYGHDYTSGKRKESDIGEEKTQKKRKVDSENLPIRKSPRDPVPRRPMLGAVADLFSLACPFKCGYKSHPLEITTALQELKTHYLESEACQAVRDKTAVVEPSSRRTK